MKERPILFSAPMVRAILEGRKTQTRRIIKPQPSEEYSAESLCCEHYNPVIVDRHGDMDAGPEIFGVYSTDGEWGVKCPYGQPGDRLWVRETWQVHRLDGISGHKEFPNILYAADQTTRLLIDKCVWKYVREKHAWRPSIHMPRWASRITLEIIGIRVERLQDISEKDAVSEGCEPDDGNPESPSPISEFRNLWESINGAESWATNPWVWVIEFKRI